MIEMDSPQTTEERSNNYLGVKDLHDKGFRLIQPPLSVMAFDPAGAGDDFPGAVEVQREEWQLGETTDPDFQTQKVYRIHRAKRLPRHLDFPDQLAWLLAVARAQKKKASRRMISDFFFAIETNGVGWPTYRSLRQKMSARRVLGVTTVATTSDKPIHGGSVKMPRLAGLDLVRVMIEISRLKMKKDAPGAKELSEELSAFVWASKNRPEAIDGQHDDLVLALAIAVWIGEKVIPPMVRQQSKRPASRARIH